MTVVRHISRQVAPLLVRPGDAKQRLDVDADPMTLARAATASAVCGVPVDVSLWVSFELLATTSANARTLEELCARVVIAAPPVRSDTMEAATSLWVRQLRRGCDFCDDTLPVICSPIRLRADLDPSRLVAAAAFAGDTARLRGLLDAECVAAASGRTLTQALSTFSAVQENRSHLPGCVRDPQQPRALQEDA